MGELAQELPQRGRRIHPAEQPRHPAGADHVQVVDAVRAGHHPGDDRGQLARRVHPRRRDPPRRQRHPPRDQLRQPGLLRQRHRRHQTRAGHQVRIIEDRRPTRPPCCSFTLSAFWIQINQDFSTPDSSVPEGTSTSNPPRDPLPIHGSRLRRVPRDHPAAGAPGVDSSGAQDSVGVTGFEPATSSSRTKRATKLRHTPCSLSLGESSPSAAGAQSSSRPASFNENEP